MRNFQLLSKMYHGYILISPLLVFAFILAITLLTPQGANAQCAKGNPANSTYCMGGGSGFPTYPAPSLNPLNYLDGDILEDGATGIVIQGGLANTARGVTTIVNNALVDPKASPPYSYSVVSGGLFQSTANPITSFSVTGNILNIGNSTTGLKIIVGKSAYGGVIFGKVSLDSKENINVSNNQVNINIEQLTSDITMSGNVVGGASFVSNTNATPAYSVVEGNTVTIDTTSAKILVEDIVYGGIYKSAIVDEKKRSEVKGNTVTLKGSGEITLNSDVRAGSSSASKLTNPGPDKANWTLLLNNKVDLDLTGASSVIQKSVVAAWYGSGSYAYFSGNTVNILKTNLAEIQGFVLGVESFPGASSSIFEGNTINIDSANIDSGVIKGEVYPVYNGAKGATENASTYLDNRLNITGGKIGGNVFAVGLNSGGIFDAQKPNVITINAINSVSLDQAVIGIGIEEAGNAQYGEVHIRAIESDVVIGVDVMGGGSGLLYNGTATKVAATYNKVSILATSKNTKVKGEVAGGVSALRDPTEPIDAKSDNNEVVIITNNDLDLVNGIIYGGDIEMKSGSVPKDSVFSASNNSVTLVGIKLANNVVGGGIEVLNRGSGKFRATGNMVALRGGIIVNGASVSLYGALVKGSSTTADTDQYTGNTLALKEANINGIFDNIANFQKYYFNVDLRDGETPILRANTIDLRDPTDNTKNATILALDTYGGQIKSIGDSFDLISATNPILVNGEYSQTVEGRHGDLISYDYLLEVDPKDDKKLKATIVGMSISPGKESVLDGLR